MIPIAKLMRLQGRSRLRKLALVLEAAERSILRDDPDAPAVCAHAVAAAAAVASSPESPPELAGHASRLRPSGTGRDSLRAIHDLRHLCMRLSGQGCADWDLIEPKPADSGPDPAPARRGLRAYLEDIRSPFNVGTIFRTAEAFGFEELILSPECADPLHARSARSAMGAVDLVSWRRATLEEALAAGADGSAKSGPVSGFGPGSGTAFALELGGTPVSRFDFPSRGIVILGSEELGVTSTALAACALGKVSIPMSGAKASLNVAVAFGILAHAWASSPDARDPPIRV